VSNEEQLQWEARLRRPAAAAAFLAGALLLAGTIVLLSIPEDRAGIEPRPDQFLSVNDSPGTLIFATALQAAAVLFMIGAFYYLFRAVVHRDPNIPRWFVFLVVAGPVMYAIAQILGAMTTVDAAEIFAERASTIGDCPTIRGEAGGDCAADLLEDNASPIGVGLGLAGTVGTAFLFVMLPLRARRAGLLSPFMSILGVIAGVLFVLPLIPAMPVILQAFWLGALGALFLGNWPGGRGPAWETGDADPWPTAAERRGLASPGEGEPQPPEPEPVPERPSSRKRRSKRG
jgi:hypothetical protein